MKKALTTDEQIAKLTELDALATQGIFSANLIERLGAVVIFAGQVDFYVIQAARLLEQVILKSQLADGKTPTFQPHDDQFFYDKNVSTRLIVRELERMLPFKGSDAQVVDNVNTLADSFVKATDRFLNYRNPLLHHLGSPAKNIEDLISLCDKIAEAHSSVRSAHRDFFLAAQPFRFSEREIVYFYGSDESK